jgi:mono/diheme cytochrome c family protein
MAKTVAAWRHVALAMIVAGSTSAASAQSSDGSFMSSRRFMQRDGEVIYLTVCQSCHMAAAQGAVGAGAYPALANDPKLAVAGYSVLVVANGSKDMPPFGALLDDEQVAAVVNDATRDIGSLQMADNAVAEKSVAAKYSRKSARHVTKVSCRPELNGLTLSFS